MNKVISNSNPNYKNYVNGLKGFACIMVMLGHYIGLYKYAEEFPFSNSISELFDSFLNSKVGFVIDEDFWVILFFVVSGYLVSMSRINSLKSFAVKSVQRFLRLGLPILFAYLFIYIIGETAGFHTAETEELFINTFIQKTYSGNSSLWTVLRSPFDVLILGNISLNGPYWVLREMFVSSIIIYFLTYLRNRFSCKNISLVISIAVLLAGLVISKIVFASIFGMFVNLIEKDYKELLKNKLFLLFAVVFTASLYFIPRSRIACLFFAALILFVPRLPVINAVLSSGIADFVSKISFGIYSFHWPVLCSFGMIILLNLSEKLNLLNSCIIAAASSALITLVFSTVYYYIIEKNIYKLLAKIRIG